MRAAFLLPVVLLGLGLDGPSSLRAQTPCPPETAARLASAWAAYRADSVAVAVPRFRAVLAACPGELDAATGLGFALLRGGETVEAGALFARALEANPASVDAWEGRARVAERAGRRLEAVEAWRRVLDLDAARADARGALDRLDPGWERPATPLVRRRAQELDLVTRVAGEGFEIRRDGRWEPFFMRGVNMGMAMPGKFPSQFPTDSSVYAGWLDLIREMNANTVRLYTVLPPEFYRALRAHNLAHPEAPLYLVHGVWTELPPGDDFDDPAFNAEFVREMHDVVDLIHGAADIEPRPGHAGGRYDADVSPWSVGYILGREWEPYSVVLYNELVGENRSYQGEYLVIEDASPTDVWMVKQCDLLVRYEMDTYNAQRPMAYTNWPTTDPIFHPTETSYAQQMEYRGLRWDPEPGAPPPHEEEGVSLDPSLAHPTDALVAGWYASYHVYPYYPDFMLYDPGYAAAASSFGASNYFGYLQELRRVHAGIPLVISEFGIPTSRNTAHLQPQGWDHGGVDEAAVAEMVARLAAEIEEVGAAGAIVFAWLDEWFKRNWFSADFEVPAERGRMWHNMLSPEQHYGLLAVRPGAPGTTPLPGGESAPWRALPVLQSGPLLGADSTLLRVGHDEGYLYLALETPALRGQPFPWERVDLQVAIDTHDREAGQMILPRSGLRAGAGFEFLLELNGPEDAQLRVTPDYNPYLPHRLAVGGTYFGEHFRRPVHSVPRLDAVFDSLWALTNRPRYIGPGELVPGQGVSMGRLRFGTAAESSLADWWYDRATGTVQVRLPWLLLNVSDPSSGMVLAETAPERVLRPVEGLPPSRLVGVPTNGMVFAAAALGPGPELVGTVPALDPYGNWPSSLLRTWTWQGWDQPTHHTYLKPAYFALQRLWAR